MAWFFRRNKQQAAVAEQAKLAQQTQLAKQQAAGGEQFQWLGERRHIANAPYVLPSDDQEINRLDFQHYMLRYALRGNYAAPLTQPTSILDVGSGTGRWAMEMAQLFPQANVVGTDLVEPKSETVAASLGYGLDTRPENYAFIQGNVLEGLPFGDNSFDFVHVRLLLFAIPAEKWPVLAREVLRVTKPGGWVESVETGPQRNGGPAMDALVQWITQTSVRRGVDPLLGPRIASFYADAGARGMQAHSVTVPVGRYGGRLGNMAEVDVFSVVGGVKPLVVSQGITDADTYDRAMAQARADLDRWQCVLPFYIAYGQKA
jgi:ubiquinone/menaquinone biosynthesis C-methylase UbiE